jgi:2'-5' RNA ligase
MVGEVLEPHGFTPERREYSAHLTIARVKETGRVAHRVIRSIVTETMADCGVSQVTALTLFRSRLSPRGSTYEPLLRVPLG